jgi:hypothetical protein
MEWNLWKQFLEELSPQAQLQRYTTDYANRSFFLEQLRRIEQHSLLELQDTLSGKHLLKALEELSPQAPLGPLQLPEPPQSRLITPQEDIESPISLKIPREVGSVHYEAPAYIRWSSTQSHIHILIPRSNLLLPLEDSRPVDTLYPDEAPGRREQQIQAILAAIDAKGWDRHAVPKGGKAILLRELVKASPGLFTPDGFKHAWKKAKKEQRIQIQNPHCYRK